MRMRQKCIKIKLNFCELTICFQTLDKDTTTLSEQTGGTVHYISPASPLSIRTVNEGDYYYYDYRTYFKYFPLEAPKILSVPSSSISCVEEELQRTLAIVRPHAMVYQDVILRAIFEAGFAFIHVNYFSNTAFPIKKSFQYLETLHSFDP